MRGGLCQDGQRPTTGLLHFLTSSPSVMTSFSSRFPFISVFVPPHSFRDLTHDLCWREGRDVVHEV